MKFKLPLPGIKKEIAGPAMDPAVLKVDYHPVSCDFTDELEHFCVLKEIILVKFWDEKLQLREIKGRILDVFSYNRCEYIKMDSGIQIRLDHIFSLATV